MNIKELQKTWNEMGKIDPLWSIIAWPEKRGNRWRVDEFFETGVNEIDAVIKYIETLGFNISRKRALDFGCGVGRLTQALGHYFDEVYGVDIAPSLIALAEEHNSQGSKITYYLNETDDLKVFPDEYFDFIYTSLTLQHMEPRYSTSYIKEFLRTINSHGVVIFQLPGESTRTIKRLITRIAPSILLNVYSNVKYGYPLIEMHGIKPENVVRFLEENGARIVDIERDQWADKGSVSFRYCVTIE